jgi:hypothetical protein
MQETHREDVHASARWKLLFTLALVFLLATMIFQPYSLPVAFRPDKTGWVFILSNYPWPAAMFSATTFHFAQWYLWVGQVVVGVLTVVLASVAKGKI